MEIAAALIGVSPWLALMAQTAPEPQGRVASPDQAALERQVTRHLQEQKPQLAIPVLRRMVSLDPKSVNAQANLGVLLHFQGQFGEAIPHLRAALLMQGDLWRIEALLGIAEKRTGDASEAVVHLERAFSRLDKSRLDKEDKIAIQVGLELIELHAAAAQFEKALAVAVKLGQMAPAEPQVLLATFEIARQTMDHTMLNMMVAAPDSAEMHMMMAGELAREGDPGKAVGQYREAIRLNPALPGVHFELAELMRTAVDPAMSAQAEAEYRAALKMNAWDALAWRQLGGIMNSKGDFKAAEEAYRKALALQPDDAETKTGLAIVLISTNGTDEALGLLESALKPDPPNMIAHFRLSSLYRRAGRAADASREMEAFRHYQELKDKMSKVFKGRSALVKQP